MLMGDYLFTNECTNSTHIFKFVIGDPKNYVCLESSDEIMYEVKGFTFNTQTLGMINFESLKNILL